ncbi:Hypothetical protein LUCI_0237 [Lucifera butyrica]|uniref:Uncharacterized protein n=1 Tax=Lucifera butyrica TaxID=1351585 RepID=A0A498R134_9FIRM|nr:hypothetical protein [Lucifera butyrica]VBB05031.1 Hypothetical protein LUCI_0237 [Lucifera butyrica]
MDKTRIESYTSEYCMSAGDNAASRKEINRSIVSKEMANEHSFREAAMEGLNAIANSRETLEETPPPPLAPSDLAKRQQDG